MTSGSKDFTNLLFFVIIFYKSLNQPIFEDNVEVSQINVNFWLASLSLKREKDLSGQRNTMCKYKRFIFGEFHVIRLLLFFYGVGSIGWVDYFLELSHSFARV